MRETADYAKTLDWYDLTGKKIRFDKPVIIKRTYQPEGETELISLGSCNGEFVSTAAPVNIGEVDEIDHDRKRYYREALKGDKKLSKLTWQFVQKNRQIFGIGYEIKEKFLAEQAIDYENYGDVGEGETPATWLREARVELISRTSGGSCGVKLSEVVK